ALCTLHCISFVSFLLQQLDYGGARLNHRLRPEIIIGSWSLYHWIVAEFKVLNAHLIYLVNASRPTALNLASRTVTKVLVALERNQRAGLTSTTPWTNWYQAQSFCVRPEVVRYHGWTYRKLLTAIEYHSGLYALAIGMGACPDWTSAIDWSARSLENNAFSRLVEAAHSVRADSPRQSANLEIMRVNHGTLSANYLATLINEYNKSTCGRKIQLFLAERDVEKMTPNIRDAKKIVVRKNFRTQQWEGYGYAESASVGSYVKNHQAPALPIWSCPATEDESNQADASYLNSTSCEWDSDYDAEPDLEEPELELLFTAGDDFQNGVHVLVTCIAHDSRPSSSRFQLLYSRLKDHLDDSSHRGPSDLEPDGSLSGKALGALADWWNSRWKTYQSDKIILYTGNSYGRFQEVTSPTNEVRKPIFLVYKDGRWHICIAGHTLPFEYEVQEAECTASSDVNTPRDSASELVHDLESTDSNTEIIAERTQELARVVERLEATSFEQTNTINGLLT
ncbi:hypothetical protein D6C85_08763, partial [Aureobasidium pullulans]